MGGFAAASCEAAHLAIRAEGDVAKSRGQASAVIFIDFASAFARTIRQLTTTRPHNVQEAQSVLRCMKFDEAAIAEITDVSITAHEWQGTSPHLAALAAELQCGTWATTDYSGDAMLPKRGFQAGVPMADVMFMNAASRTLRCIRPGPGNEV